MSGPMTGRHLGRALADIMHDARVAAGTKLIAAETDHRAAYHTSFMEQVEQDLAPTMRAMFQEMYDHPDCPPEARAYLGPMLHPEHQGQFILTVLGLLGLGLSGPSAAAAGWTQRLQNLSRAAHGELNLTPDQAAEGVLKGQLDHGYAAEQARTAGMHADTFDALIALTGDPPGPQELMEALRRGYIDEGRFSHGIREGRTRDEWIDVLLKLRFAPPAAGLAISAAVQGHLDDAASRRHVEEAGIDPSNYDWMLATAGRPPGAQEMIQLLRRHKVTPDVVRQAIRESDIKNKYIDAIIELAEVVPPQRTVVSGLRQGAVDEAQARTWLEELGYPAAAVDMLIKEAHSTKSTSVRDLTAAEVVSAYVDGLTDRARATSTLEAMRYSPDAAGELLALADAKRENALLNASIRRVHSAYVGHRIDAGTAGTRLDALHMDAGSRDQALKLWAEERAANVRPLTEAQVVALHKAGILTDADFIARHVQMGYTPDDAALLLQLHPGPQTTGA